MYNPGGGVDVAVPPPPPPEAPPSSGSRNPTVAASKSVSTGTTGHAEAIKITYDPAKTSYGKLLKLFFSVAHDPTELNYQGPDHGTQYRSVIFVHDPVQRAAAEASKSRQQAARRWPQPIVTTIESAGPFWRAEDYHQQYLHKRGLGSCHL